MSETTSQGKPTIFVVDDNESLLNLYEIWLTADGKYNVVKAATEHDAIDTISDGVDAALIDRSLPDGDGLSVVEHMHENGIDIPVMLVSARDILPENELHEMVVGQITKPMGEEDVVGAVDQLVQQEE